MTGRDLFRGDRHLWQLRQNLTSWHSYLLNALTTLQTSLVKYDAETLKTRQDFIESRNCIEDLLQDFALDRLEEAPLGHFAFVLDILGAALFMHHDVTFTKVSQYFLTTLLVPAEYMKAVGLNYDNIIFESIILDQIHFRRLDVLAACYELDPTFCPGSLNNSGVAKIKTW